MQTFVFRFPEDLSPLIRSFMGPTRVDWRTCKLYESNRVKVGIAILNKYRHSMNSLEIEEWPEVKKLLYTDKADKVIEALTTFAYTVVVIKNAKQAEWDINPFTFPDWEERKNEEFRLHNLISTNTWIQRKYRRELFALMGKEDLDYEDFQESDSDDDL